MAIRKIRMAGDIILTKKSKPVAEYNQALKDLLSDMRETMRQNDGLGLAAPQVGVLRRVIILEIDDLSLEIINPELKHEEDISLRTEACLSNPDIQGDVLRPRITRLRYFDGDGVEWELYSEDANMSQAICHEIDHLNGVLYTTKAINIKPRPKREDNDEPEEGEPESILDLSKITIRQI